MKNRDLQHKHQRGQVTIEMILIMTILFGLSVMISDAFTKNNYFATIIEGPWDYVDGMIRDGVWRKSSGSLGLNPNNTIRHGTFRGKDNSPKANFDAAESCLAMPPQGC